MKVIILSASIGGGHMSAADAIAEYLSKKGIKTKIVDTLEYISHILNKTISETYFLILKRSPQLWKMMYKTSNRNIPNKIISSSNMLISKKMLPLIKDFHADIVISTHPFATEMISRLKKSNKLNIPLICVMTDYAPHMAWISPKVDAYIVANEHMISSMKDMGVRPSTIYPFGIPVREKFFIQYDKNVLLKELGLSDSTPIILVMSGSDGITNIKKVYDTLQNLTTKCQIVMITGKNPKLYECMQSLINENNSNKRRRSTELFKMKRGRDEDNKLTSKSIRLIYFTYEVSKYMQVADLLITKPGGLTISESLACNLPMILFDAIPGQEVENAEFLVKRNMAIKLNDPVNDAKIIDSLFKDRKRLEIMKFNCAQIDKSDVLSNLYHLINELYNKYNLGDDEQCFQISK